MPDEHDPSHLDKHSVVLAIGDEVELVYGGDQHRARVVALTRHLDVDHVELELATHATVPSSSVTFVKKGPLLPEGTLPKTEEKKETTATHHRPARTTSRSK
jgi:hypothetical protein